MNYTQEYQDCLEAFNIAEQNFDANPSKTTAKALSDARVKLASTERYSKADSDRMERERCRRVRQLFQNHYYIMVGQEERLLNL